MKKAIALIVLACLLLTTLAGCGDGGGSGGGTSSGKDSIIGKWYDSSDRCLDVRSDGTYRLDGEYGTGTWKKLDDGYEFYDFYGSVSEAELVNEKKDSYVDLDGRKYYKEAPETESGSNGSTSGGSTVDESFLENTTPSEGLSYTLSSDKTYYILTDNGTCKDKHIVVPEYPVDYNPTIPVKEVNLYALEDCDYVTLPTSVTSIQSISRELKALNFLGDMGAFCRIKGLNVSYLENISLYVNGRLLEKDITIPETVTAIPDNFLRGYSKITSVTIAGNATTIGDYAFQGCDALTTVNISGTVSAIGDYAFQGCDALASISLSDTIDAIGKGAFWGTAYSGNSSNWKSGLLYAGNYLIDAKADVTAAQIKDGTVGIASYAFPYTRSGWNTVNENLTSVVIPSSLKWIGENAFVYCGYITTATFKGTAAEWSGVTVGSGNNNLTKVLTFDGE